MSLDLICGVCSSTNSSKTFLRSVTSISHAFKISEADGLSNRAKSRCSTVTNSCFLCLASIKAICRVTSNSCAIITIILLPLNIVEDAGSLWQEKLPEKLLLKQYLLDKSHKHLYLCCEQPTL